MQDADGSVPFFWGADSEENLVLSDDREIIKKGCGKSFAPFPKGALPIQPSNFALGPPPTPRAPTTFHFSLFIES